MPRQPPGSTLFPYTTLFRSLEGRLGQAQGAGAEVAGLVSRLGAVEQQMTAGRQETTGLTDDVASVSGQVGADRKSTRLNSSHSQISYAVFCLKKKIS